MTDSGVRKELEKLDNQRGAKEALLLGVYDEKPEQDEDKLLKGIEKIKKWYFDEIERLVALQADKAVQDELSRLLAHFDNNPVELSVISDRLAGLKGEGWGSPMDTNNPSKVASENTLREQVQKISLRKINDIYYVPPGIDGSVGLTDEQLDRIMQAFTAAVETALITELEQIAKMNGATKVPSPLVAEYVSERLAEMVGTSAKMAQHVHKSKEGESLE